MVLYLLYYQYVWKDLYQRDHCSNIKWLMMFFKTRGRFSVISSKGYDSMFIKDLVMWRHYNVILENNNITTRPWQCLAIIWIFSALTWYETILVLNIKGKVNKIAIISHSNVIYYDLKKLCGKRLYMYFVDYCICHFFSVYFAANFVTGMFFGNMSIHEYKCNVF